MKLIETNGLHKSFKTYRQLFGYILLLLFITTTFLGCDSTNSSLKKVTLNEVAHSIFYAPQYVAYELGYFKEEGIDLVIETGFGADKVMTALVSGNADIGFMGSESSIYVYQEGKEDYAINFAQLTQRAGNFLVGREENKDFTWEDLKGSTVLGGREGGMPQMVFEYILKKHNINPTTDLTMVQNIDFGSTAAAFIGGKGDYTVEFEPHATSLEEQGKGYVLDSLGVESGYVPYTAYCVQKSYLAENQETIQAFTNALQKGMDYVNEHSPEEIATVIAPQFPETKIETIATIINRYKNQDTWGTDLMFKEESFQLLQDILKESGQLKENIPYDVLITTEFAKKAMKNNNKTP